MAYVCASARLSKCERYRYLLTRVWEEHAPKVTFVMLNPSTADASLDDPTIRRCVAFARKWDFGTLEVVNLFSWRATKPTELIDKGEDAIGYRNDMFIRDSAQSSALVVCAWGVHGVLQGRDAQVLDLLRENGIQPRAMALTKAGFPSHPLYLKGDLKPALKI